MKTQNRHPGHVLIAVILTFALALLGLASFSALPAFAIDPRPIPEPIDPPDVIDPIFKAPANGFDWKMAPRFGGDRDGDHVIDYHWDEASAIYDPAHVRPSQFAVFFRGCPDKDENRRSPNGVNSYKWEFLTTDGSTILLGNSHSCRPLFSLPPQGVVEPTPWDASYRIKLTITSPDNQSQAFENIVHVRDYLIVSIGDSYGSGEGNPDVPQVIEQQNAALVVTQTAKWVDRRCHRSAFAGPAQAALAIEGADPQTSVTFLSFACSGAAVHTDSYAPYENAPPEDPYAPGNPNKPVGSGLLGSYLGVQPLVFPPNYKDPDYTDHLQPQIKQVADAVGDRPIDALMISAGGNDAGFAPIAQVCVLKGDCPNALVTARDNSAIRLQDRVEGDLSVLIGKYDQLAACIQSTGQPCVLDLNDGSQATISSLGVNPAHIYITEYPDGTRQDTGETCDAILDDVVGVFWLKIDREEGQWAADAVAGSSNPARRRGVNGVLSGAAEKFGWNLVDGVSSQFAGPSYGHGYCAHNNWIRRARESALLQGPPRPNPNEPGIIFVDGTGAGSTNAQTKGTLHPTAEGYQAYSRALVPMLKASLYDSGSEPAQGPTYSSTNTDDNAQSDEGTNGWLIGRCPTGGPCVSDYAVLTVQASDPSGILGASLSIDGIPDCTTAGVICNSAALVDPQTYSWSFNVAEGMHRLDFSVRSVDGQVATFSREVKVDLNAPAASATVASASPATGGWYRTPVTVTFQGTDSASGSGVASIDYWLNGATSSVRVGVGETLEIKTDGTHTIQYQAVDWAGHTGAMQTLTFKIDQTAPVLTCGTADGLWHASDVSLGCNASDSGSALANPADATFSLTTSVAQGTETAAAETNSRKVCDVAGNCAQAGPIGGNKIDKKNPAVVITTPAQGAVYFLGASVTADYTCSDGGSGVASCAGTAPNGNPIDTSSIGVKTFGLTTKDGVGNTAAVSLTYEVHYDFRGFFAPVDNKDTSGNFILNTVKAGSAVPVKFSLSGDQGLNVLASGTATSPNPKSEAVNCTTSGTEDVVEETVNAGGSSLSYDASADQYTYVWKTDKAWATTCRLFKLTLSDGTLHQAKFKFTK